MNALAPISDKLGKLLRLLSSDRDGEIVGAARAIVRTLESVGLDIHALASTVNGDAKFTEADARKIYQQGVEDGKRAVEDTRLGPGDFRNIDGTPDWEKIAQFCHARAERLREKEREFVNDMAGRVVWRKPTERQGKWLLSIFYKLGGGPQ